MQPNLSKTAVPGTVIVPCHPTVTTTHAERRIAADALGDCAKFTSEAIQIAFSPKFSALIHGIKLLSQPRGGQYLSGLEQGTGALLLAASPVWLVVRLALGIPGMVLGGVATAAVAIAAGGEALLNKIEKPTAPSAVESQQNKVMEAFVVRMHETLKSYSFMEQRHLKANPAQLIATSLLIVAFRARQLEGRALKVENNVLKESDLQNQEEKYLGYFKKICDVKSAIASLNLSLDDEYGWSYLLEALEGAAINGSHPIGDVETLNFIMAEVLEMSEQICNDPLFQRAWEKSLD